MKLLFKFFITIVLCVFIILSGLFITNDRTETNEFSTNIPIPIETKNPNPVYEEIVYVTYSGSKYHKRSCEFVIGHSIKAYKKSQAEELGFEPCYKCMQDNN